MIVWSKIQKPCGKYECTFPTSTIIKRVISTQVLLMKCTRNVTTSIKSKLFSKDFGDLDKRGKDINQSKSISYRLSIWEGL